MIKAFKQSIKSLRANPGRTILTMLGIVIGVAAVVTMVTLGNGATASVSQQISSLGSNLILLMPGQRMGMATSATAPLFKIADADAIASQITGAAHVAPTATSALTAVAGSKNWHTSVTGSMNDYFIAGNWKLADGRTFSDSEERGGNAVCVLGDRVRRELFGTENPIGDEVRLQKFSCQIIGLLAAKGQGSMGNDQDDLIVAPLRTVQRRLTGNDDVSSIMISAQDGASTDRVKSQIELLMRERRKIGAGGDNNFNVLDTKQIAVRTSIFPQAKNILGLFPQR